MEKKLKMLLLFGLPVVGLVVGVLFWSIGTTEGKGQSAAQETTAVFSENRQSGHVRRRVKKTTAVPVRLQEKRRGEKPNVFQDIDEAELTDLAKKVLESLQNALDRDDYSEIRKILAMCSEAPRGSLSRTGKVNSDLIPVLLRRKLVEAMGWFGAEAIPDLVGFIADADENVSQMSKDQFQLALEDITLSDYERAKIVVLAAQAVTDSDFLEQVFAEINDMRHSVGASALVDICQNGTEEAKALMPDAIEFFTGEDNIKTVEDVEKWLEENPDGPDDDDLYGGVKDE